MDSTIPEVYVLWHPACPLGEPLAREIYAWLRPGYGLGPQVFYRSLPAPESPAGGLPPPIPGESRLSALPPGAGGATHGNTQIVVALIDENMIADAAWRHWLADLPPKSTDPAPGRFVLPVALDATAFNVPASMRELNFLRPAGLPLPEANPPGPKAAVEKLVRSLLKQLTEALCRLMLGRGQSAALAPAPAVAVGETNPKVTIFLSHAKADGMAPARRIRDYIYGQTQLAAFYDENDIPFGSVFGRVLNASLVGDQTAALVVVQTARYASRPWCRRELSLFRRPLRDGASAGGLERWRMNPTVVVDALEGGAHSTGIPELGNAPVIRWSDQTVEQEEQVVTFVLRDALLSAFHAALGRTMPDERDCIVLNWLPDPGTLLHIPRVRSGAEKLRLIYPGRGLSGLELAILDELFPSIAFYSFDKVLS